MFFCLRAFSAPSQRGIRPCEHGGASSVFGVRFPARRIAPWVWLTAGLGSDTGIYPHYACADFGENVKSLFIKVKYLVILLVCGAWSATLAILAAIVAASAGAPEGSVRQVTSEFPNRLHS